MDSRFDYGLYLGYLGLTLFCVATLLGLPAIPIAIGPYLLGIAVCLRYFIPYMGDAYSVYLQLLIEP